MDLEEGGKARGRISRFLVWSCTDAWFGLGVKHVVLLACGVSAF